MDQSKRKSFCTPERSWILWGIPIIFLAGSLLHFAYDWSGMNPIVGLFSPINESIWEHLKIAYFPTLLWWLVGFFRYKNEAFFHTSKWFISSLVALVTSCLSIVSIFYSYTGALGVTSLVFDIVIFFIGVSTGQMMGDHIYYFAKIRPVYLIFALIVIMLLSLIFFLFTFYPPELPLFIDNSAKETGGFTFLSLN